MVGAVHAVWNALVQRVNGATATAAALLLLSSGIAAVVVFIRSGEERTARGFVRFLVPHAIVTHRSARADFAFWITRKLLMLPLAIPTGLSVAAGVAFATHAGLVALFGPIAPPSAAPGAGTLVLFTVSMLLAYDLSYYLYHTLQHRVPILWELHKVHHSAEVMVGTTKDRIHPVDELMNKAWDGLMTGPLYGVWMLFVLSPAEVTILGVNVYILRNIIMMDFVRHTHLKVSFGRWLNEIVLCPHYHQLHHSVDPRHYDRNFGLMLTVWDRMFGTLCVPRPGESFTFGLEGNEAQAYQSLRGLYVLPLQRMAGHLRTLWPRRAAAPGRPRGA